MRVKGIMAVSMVVVLGLVMAVFSGCGKDDPAANQSNPVEEPAVFANTTCPIMDSPIKPEKVTANLVREYKGEKVAFCCAGCPDKWDALSDEEKAKKLEASK